MFCAGRLRGVNFYSLGSILQFEYDLRFCVHSPTLSPMVVAKAHLPDVQEALQQHACEDSGTRR